MGQELGMLASAPANVGGGHTITPVAYWAGVLNDVSDSIGTTAIAVWSILGERSDARFA
jgi:hypothetical protein